MVPSGHVQRAPYIQPYFRLSLWSSILWRPLRGEHSSTHFVVHRLTATVKMPDALDPSGGRVAIPNDGNVAMRLLAAAWRQKKPAPAQLCRKGAATYQTQVMLPFHHKCAVALSCMSSFWSLPVLQLICEAKSELSTKHRCSVCLCQEHVVRTSRGSVLGPSSC